MKNKENVPNIDDSNKSNSIEIAVKNVGTLTEEESRISQTAVKKSKSNRMGRRTFFMWTMLFLIGTTFCFLYLASFGYGIIRDSIIYFADSWKAPYSPVVSIFLLIPAEPLYFIVFWLYIKASIKRLHDMNLSGWYCLLYIPQTLFLFVLVCVIEIRKNGNYDCFEITNFILNSFASIAFWYFVPVFNMFLCCFKGTDGENKYGEKPNS